MFNRISILTAFPIALLCFGAIPATIAQPLSQTAETDPTKHFVLGVAVRSAESRTAGKGHLITGVEPNSPAALAGLKINDIILSVNGIRTAETRTFHDLVQNFGHQPILFRVERDGKWLSPRVTPERRYSIVDSENIRNALSDIDSVQLKGRVRIRLLDDMGVLVLSGMPRDLDIVEAAINDFLGVADQTKPKQVLIRLVNSSAQRASETLSEIYNSQYSSRFGPATISPTLHPPGLIVVGRPKGIEVIRTIVSSYDGDEYK